MLRNITIRTRLILVLILIMVCVLLLAVYNISSLENMYEITSRIYEHPLIVSNASRSASLNLVKIIHHIEHELPNVQVENAGEVIESIKEMDKLIYEEMDLIQKTILGEEGRLLAQDVRRSYEEWQPMKEQIYAYILEGDLDQANTYIQSDVNDYTLDLEKKFEDLNAYARNKADVFIQEAEKKRKEAMVETIVAYVGILIFATTTMLLVIRTTLPDIERLQQSILEMTSGNALKEVEINGDNEIAKVALGLNKLIRKLKREIWVKDGLNVLELILEKQYGIKEFADRTTEFLLKYTNSDIGMFYEVIETQNKLNVLSYHSYLPIKKNVFFEYDHPVIKEVLTTKRGVLIEIDKRFEKLEYSLNHHIKFVSTYLYPLLREESVIGIIKLSSTKGFSKEEIEFMDLSASLIAADLMVVNRQDKIEKLLDQTNQMNEQLRNKSYTMEELYSETEMHKEELEIQTKELNSTIETLKETQEQLVQSEKLSSLASIVTGIAHEINTPLGISHTTVTYMKEIIDKMIADFDGDTMRRDYFESFLKNLNESIEVVEENNRRSVELIKNFKDIAVDQTSGNYRQYNIKDYLVEIVGSLRVLLRQANVKTIIDAPDDLVIGGYPGAMSQIMTNLIMNSIKHGFLNREKGEISIDVEAKGNRVIVVYKDNGIGIEAINLKRIFDPFFTTQRGKGGSGLGLNIVYNLITKNLNGTISARNGDINGVEFIIEFPKMVRRS